MTKLAGIILGATAVVVAAIVLSLPLLVTAATLCACGTLLMALLRYFQTLEV